MPNNAMQPQYKKEQNIKKDYVP